ncbi:metallophosphoesterase [Actinopolymorpha sp. B9G3]|uniref:metallophosphoesterase n=1 Tax=Actinopolymorpha sp. B9G3 TaxID=3158970 RepID=UPI0032D9A02E
MTRPRSRDLIQDWTPSRRRLLGLSALGAATVPFGIGAGPAGAVEPLRFGVIADCQYADVDTAGTRHYRESVHKLREAVAAFNDADLDFALHLGDFVDRLAESFADVVPTFEKLRMSKFHVLGNHDFQMPLGELLETLRMPAPYHHFRRNGWRFVVVDTNDISLYANPKGSEKYELARAMLDRLTAEGAVNAQTWNGAVGEEQLAWLRRVLDGARSRGERVVLNSHHPIYPKNVHNTWNDDELVDLVTSYDNVVAWFNGHNHHGNYGFAGGKHFVTFHGMVELDTNAYATVRVLEDRFEIDGYGREPDRIVPFGRPATELAATAG